MKKYFYNSLKVILTFLILFSISGSRVYGASHNYDDILNFVQNEDELNGRSEYFVDPLFLYPDNLGNYFYRLEDCNSSGFADCDKFTFRSRIPGTTEYVTFSILPRDNSGFASGHDTNHHCSLFEDDKLCINNKKICAFLGFENSGSKLLYKASYREVPELQNCGGCTTEDGFMDRNLYGLNSTNPDEGIINTFDTDYNILPPVYTPDTTNESDAEITAKSLRVYLINDIFNEYLKKDYEVCKINTALASDICNESGTSFPQYGYYDQNTFFCWSSLTKNINIEDKNDNENLRCLLDVYRGEDSSGNDAWVVQSPTRGVCFSEESAAHFGFDLNGSCAPGSYILAKTFRGQEGNLAVYWALASNDKISATCGWSQQLYNLSYGRHCYSEQNTTEPVPCGTSLIPNSDNYGDCDIDNLTLVNMCFPNSSHKYCVGEKDGSLTKGLLEQASRVYDWALKPDDNYPEQGYCLNCVEENSAGTIEGQSCEIYSDDYIGGIQDIEIYDNCCSTDFFCSKEDGSTIAGTCQPVQEFSTCSGDTKPFLELGTADVIPQGEVCNYINDDIGNEKRNNACDKCSAVGSPIKNSSGDDICPFNSKSQTPSGGGEEYNFLCRDHCGCLDDDKCIIPRRGDIGSCSAKACVDEDEANPDNLPCCDGNLTPDPTDDNKCSLDCGSSEHNPPNKCIDACCESILGPGLTCTEGNTCGLSVCVDEGIGACCGQSKECNDEYECVAATSGPCANDYSSRPPRGGYGRPDEKFSIEEFITAIVGILYPLSVILGMIYIVIGGYQFLTSKGEPEGVKKAQQTLTSAIFGLIFILMSATILRFIVNTLLGI